MSSDTRMPVAYSTSMSARSRRPRGVVTSGCWMRRLHFLDGQKFRQRRPGARRPQIVGRIGFEMLREHREAVEAAHGRHRPRDRSRRQAFAHHAGHEMLQRVAIEAQQRRAGAGGKPGEVLQVAAVAFERVIGQAALHAQVRQIGVDEGVVRPRIPLLGFFRQFYSIRLNDVPSLEIPATTHRSD